MADRIQIAGVTSVIIVNGQGIAYPLGLVENVRLEKQYVTEPVIEIGSFEYVEILRHGYGARFSWGRSYTIGDQLVANGFIPRDREIAQVTPFFLRLVDHLGQRDIALIHKGVVETFTIEANGRARLLSNITGIACSLITEDELN